MPFEIVRNDIVSMQVDAIVNSANPEPVVGSGVDAGIHKAAGDKLLQARRRIGPIRMGDCAITKGYQLPAKHVIHAVSPVWQGGDKGEEELLRRCYDKALAMAARHRCGSIAFPLLGSGNYGFPKDRALKAAVAAISEFLMGHEMMVYLVVFSRSAVEISEKLFSCVKSFIDEHYIEEKTLDEYGVSDAGRGRRMQLEQLENAMNLRRQQAELQAMRLEEPRPEPMAARPAKKQSLDDMLGRLDEGFSQTLLRLIDRSGMKDSQVYKKANVDRKLFSKIRNNPAYRPGKATVLAFALALELDLEGTKDLLERAGFALSHSSKFDIIVEYFIRERNYNVFEINEVLFMFDQPLIGG